VPNSKHLSLCIESPLGWCPYRQGTHLR
jgi:hypothetical protein